MGSSLQSLAFPASSRSVVLFCKGGVGLTVTGWSRGHPTPAAVATDSEREGEMPRSNTVPRPSPLSRNARAAGTLALHWG